MSTAMNKASYVLRRERKDSAANVDAPHGQRVQWRSSGRVVRDDRPMIARVLGRSARDRITGEVEEVADGRVVFAVVDTRVIDEVADEREPAEQLVIDAPPRRNARGGVARVLVRRQRRREPGLRERLERPIRKREREVVAELVARRHPRGKV